MPKEATHWAIAEKTAERLGGTALGEAALACPNALKLGAIYPDLPYYLTGTGDLAKRAAALGNRYHGAHGEDTYDLPRALLAGIEESDAPARRAMLVGVASHLCADAAFHPLVYFVTGNYYDPDPARRSKAIRGHRRFEGLLDMVLCGGTEGIRGCNAKQVWEALEEDASTLLPWSVRRQTVEGGAAILAAASEKFLEAQPMFGNPVAGLLAAWMTPWLPGHLKELAALFYGRPSAKALEKAGGAFEYRNPATGDPCAASARQLMEKAIDDSAALCAELETALGNGDAKTFRRAGPSLNFGIVGAGVDRARYFAAETWS